MVPDSAPISLPCPDPFARAPRAGGATPPRDRLMLAPPSLQGALGALICRDTTGAGLSDVQRLSHFPASPMVTLSWFHGAEGGLVDTSTARSGWRPFGASIVFSGSHTHPMVTWASDGGRGYIACFLPDVVRALFGFDPAVIQDRFVPVHEVVGREWAPLWEALLGAGSDAAAMQALERGLAPRWQAIHDAEFSLGPLRRLGRHWVERLAWQAHDWRRTRSPRQVERRVKAFSGRSLREWQSLTRTEGVFFAARERYENGEGLDWATLALDEGFADQAHMSRAIRQIGGFAPTEFVGRYLEDESFWVYRLWV